MFLGPRTGLRETCPTGAIRFGSKEEMKLYAEQRVADLKSRGYENAGIYDPEGVGGTHVMYVLHHADKPELYSGLPKDPKLTPPSPFERCIETSSGCSNGWS